MTTSATQVFKVTGTVSGQPYPLSDKISRESLTSYDLVGNMAKSSMGTLFLLSSFIFASMWFANGITWIYDRSIALSPLTSCVSAYDYNPFSEAGFCAVDIYPWSQEMYDQIKWSGLVATSTESAQKYGLCVLPLQDSSIVASTNLEKQADHALELGPISCYSLRPCAQTTDWTEVNPYSVSSLDSHAAQTSCSVSIWSLTLNMQCFQLSNVQAFCDSKFSVDPAGIVAIRGLLFGVLLLWICLISKDLFLYFKVFRINRNICKYRETIPTIVAERNMLMDKCMSKWNKGPETCLSLVSSSGCSTPVGTSSNVRLPCQPILARRMSIVTDLKASVRGYSPRLGSSAGATTPKSGGALFQSSWRKKVARHFELRATNIESVKYMRTSLIFNYLLYSTLVTGFFVLVFRLILLIVTLPLITNLPGGQSLTYLAGLSDRVASLVAIIGYDARSDNVLERPVLFMWVDFLAYGDLVLETCLLLIPACIALIRPTNLKCVDKSSFLKPSDVQLDSDVSALTGTNRFGIPESDGSDCLSPVSVLSELSPRKHPLHSNTGLLRASMQPEYEPSGTLVCVLVSVCSPCATKESREVFVENLKSIRSLVESDCDIFVVDCGSNRSPLDNTEFVIQSEVSSDIHYVYYPENNRILSLYWTSKYWIPYTFASGMCGDYMYSLIVDESIRFPATFTLPTSEFFERNPKIKAMYIPLNEKVVRVAQWKEQIDLVAIYQMTGSTLHVGEDRMPQIWERNAFEMTCFNIHVPIKRAIEPLCLKANGRLLLKERGNSKMTPWISGGLRPLRVAQAYGPYNGGAVTMMSFRSNMTEIINPSSFLHWPSFIGKYAILVEIVNVFYDTLRIFLITAMLLRDPLGLVIVSLICSVFATIPYGINLLMNMQHQDRKLKRALFLFFVFPITLIFIELPLRILRVFRQKTFKFVFRSYETDVSIGEREEEFRDLPIVPQHPSPHWSTVWLS